MAAVYGIVNELEPEQISVIVPNVKFGFSFPVPFMFITNGVLVASLLVSVIVAFFTPVELGSNFTVNVAEFPAAIGLVG